MLAERKFLIVNELARIRADMLPELWGASAEQMFRTAIENTLDRMGISKGPISEELRPSFDAGVVDETAKLI